MNCLSMFARMVDKWYLKARCYTKQHSGRRLVSCPNACDYKLPNLYTRYTVTKRQVSTVAYPYIAFPPNRYDSDDNQDQIQIEHHYHKIQSM